MIKKFLEVYTGKAVGIITEEIRIKGKRVGFKVKDIFSGKENVFAHLNFSGPLISKYHVDIEKFESIAILALKREGDLYVIDEIGRMELLSKNFEFLVLDILSSDKNVIATLNRRYVHKYKEFGDIIWLERKYWGKIFDKVLKAFGKKDF